MATWDSPTNAVGGASKEELADLLEQLLTKRPGSTARELARLLRLQGRATGPSSLVKTFVNSALYSFRTRFRKVGDARPEWHVISTHVPRRGPEMATRRWQHVATALDLWPWQRKALKAWIDRRYRGVVEGVTGTGKTHVGLAAAELFTKAGWKVAVVVPTLELQEQWQRMIVDFLPHVNVGRFGGGFNETFYTRDVLVVSVATGARWYMLAGGQKGLLIADECHRYGAERWSLALEEEFSCRLGLTPAYERADNGLEEFLDPYFSGLCFELHYDEALREEIIAPFKIAFVGVRFSGAEQMSYDQANEIYGRSRARLINEFGLDEEQPFGEFMKAAKRVAESEHREERQVARAFLAAFSRRRQLLAEATGKLARLAPLAAAIKRAQRTILFTHTKEAARRVVRMLREYCVPAAVLDADVGRDERTRILRAFDSGEYMAVAAPKLLNEGVDIPDADLGIVVAASRSRLEMVQRMGRILRKKQDGRLARFVVVYVLGTSEDPEYGAHETFINHVQSHAADLQYFAPETPAQEICAFLNDWQSNRTQQRRRDALAKAERALENARRVLEKTRRAAATSASRRAR